MTQDDNFLKRWSARKQAVLVEDAQEPVEATDDDIDAPEKSDAEILAELDLKDPDDMVEGDDFSAFMSSAVPTHLRNRALRKLWVGNPTLANLDGLVDYGEDFTDAAYAGIPVNTIYQVGKGMVQKVEELVERLNDASEFLDPDTDSATDATSELPNQTVDIDQDLPSEPMPIEVAEAATVPLENSQEYQQIRARKRMRFSFNDDG